MDRRQFLRRIMAGAAATAAAGMFDPELLLWKPGARTFFLPPAVAGNHLISPDWVTQEALRLLTHNLKFVSSLNTEYFDPYKVVGQTIKVPMPWRYSQVA